MRSPSLVVLAILACSARTTARAEDLSTVSRRYVADFAAAHAKVYSVAGIPSFSRQTGLACNVCHTSFPQLTSFGRTFKLNGYTLTGLQTVKAGDSGSRESLRLGVIPPISAMVMTSLTQVSTAIPGTQNGNVEFPQQLSLFFGEAITPRLGTFLQLTYDPVAGQIGMDNVDIRYANQTHLGSTAMTYGFSLNNNPTVQDVWNTVPAWGYPYAASSVAPAPGASTLLDGALGQQVAGLGAYAVLDNHLYGEFSLYRSAFQGGPHPPDSTASNTIHSVSPYWRAYYEHPIGERGNLMIGTMGMSATIYPVGVTGLTNRFTDIAFDAQFEHRLGEGGNFSAHAIWIHEQQKLAGDVDAGLAANLENKLQTLRIDASAYTRSRIGFTAGYFSTTGDSDVVRYAPGEISGFAAGSPNSSGFIGEISALPWLNTRFSLQYVHYTKFNGASLNYDGAGRNAKDNNTLYLLTWLVF